ncbi:hypothetical protein Sta7437_1567 [Stanieria cyanosphaera PCC 7437]|uniref:Glycosyltransferase RgtA/B/C/D-like domain-containing protein n=1 Tax=Stanieria cyanosphaera (strain ATCC 29371 / PCC 7437) TaxID=111780 RepID=K9XSU2_STAC7|nr:hypothetical protein [Stanieria cyanosphaera]AFZ35134.1 hypothetical protein Sta7437_1567 [Stanieria cyanosphaera PCC 7437]
MFFFKSKYNFWLALSIATAILFSLAGLKLAFQSPYTIQDDARQHIFWMQQFNAPELFSGDLIADYFQSVAPWGFTNLYKFINKLGINIFWLNKISPLLIGVVTSIYCFLVCLEIFPVPLAGFIATLLLNQNLWMLDDLSSGTPRAFFYPLFLAFVYYLLKQSLLLCLLIIILQGLFYPQTVLLSAVVLIIKLITEKNNRLFCLSGLLTAGVILLIYSLKTSQFGNVITVNEAKLLPEFYAEGRNTFFLDNPVTFWLSAQRSGFFPREWQYVLLCSFGLILPWLKLLPNRFPLVTKINSNIRILWQVFLAASIMFGLAHLFLFKLHLPSRYSQHTLRILIALIDGITVAILLNSFRHWFERKFTQYQPLTKNLISVGLISLLLYPTYAVQAYPYRLGYVEGKALELYQFLQQQPKDYLIATLSSEGDFIPTFAKKRVLVSQEYAIPYHLDYYQSIRQRVKDLIHAQYSQNLTEIQNFINQYQIDLWLIDQNAFQVEYLNNNFWLKQFQPELNNAISIVKQKQELVLARLGNECNIFPNSEFKVLSASCIANFIRSNEKYSNSINDEVYHY